MLTRFHQFSGFDAEIVKDLGVASRIWLAITGAWVFFGIAVSALSAGYLFLYCTQSWLLSLLAFLIVFVLMLALQVMLISGTGASCILPEKELKAWRPNFARSALILSLALVCSQPILLFLYQNNVAQSSFGVEQAQQDQALRLHDLTDSLQERENAIRQQIAIQSELLSRLRIGTPATSVLNEAVPDKPVQGANANSRRKALLIGNQHYSRAQLSNPIKDTNDLAVTLQKIGFNVSVVHDGTRKAMELAILRYMQSLKPGDISLFYFSGHGYQANGSNYLLAVDARDNAAEYSVSAGTVVESLSRRTNLTANIVLIDACRVFVSQAQGGLASIEAGKNTYIALSAKPGQTSIDGPPGTNGLFTHALLNHITKPIDLDMVFREVRKEVAESSQNRQNTWSTNNLTTTPLILASSEYANSPGSITQLASTQGVDQDRPKLPSSECEVRAEKMSGDTRQHWLENCVTANILKLQDDLRDHAVFAREEMAMLNDETNHIDRSPARLLTLYFSFWTHPAFLILGTLLMMLLIAGGFIAREYWLPGLPDYEKLGYESNRQLVNQAFDELRGVVSKFPYAPSDAVSKLVWPFDGENTGRRVKSDRGSHQSLFDRFNAQPAWGSA